MYLNVAGGGTTNGANVQIWSNPDNVESQWRVVQVSSGVFAIENVKAVGEYLNVAGGLTTDGANVQLWQNRDSTDTQWHIARVQNVHDVYLLENVRAPGKFLNVAGGGKTLGTNVHLWGDPSASSQWRFVPKGWMDQTILNAGMDCWGRCNGASKSGYCDFCGVGNACCKRGFASDPEECKRALAFQTDHHECVELEVLHPADDCWGKADQGLSGLAEWCGRGNACCKKGFPEDPPVCKRAVNFKTNHHECVRLTLESTHIAQAQDEAARKRAEQKAQEEAKAAERKAAAERAEADRKAKEEADRKARDEANRKAKEEAERKAREEADRRAKAEAERKAAEEADSKARMEAARKAKEEADRRAREDTKRKADEEARQRAETERHNKEKAERQAQPELAPALANLSQTISNEGKDCWGRCGKQQSGYCDFCGVGNACCNKGRRDKDPPECKRAIRFMTDRHECVGLHVLNEAQDCWGKCGKAMSGYCDFCGPGNACCKRGFNQDPAECKRAVGFRSGFHECVRLVIPELVQAPAGAQPGNQQDAGPPSPPQQQQQQHDERRADAKPEVAASQGDEQEAALSQGEPAAVDVAQEARHGALVMVLVWVVVIGAMWFVLVPKARKALSESRRARYEEQAATRQMQGDVELHTAGRRRNLGDDDRQRKELKAKADKLEFFSVHV